MEAATSLARGMAVQVAALRAALAAGMPRAGWKIGLNFPEVQKRLGLDGSAVGWLDGRHILSSGSPYTAAAGAKLHIEAEVCLRLGVDVSASATPAQARAAIAAVAPALELVDYALSWDGIEAIVGHSMFHAATVLGGFAPLADWPELGTSLPLVSIAEEEVARARGDLVPVDLGAVVVRAASCLAGVGESLRGGDLLLSGSYTNPLRAPRNALVTASFGPLGSVSIDLRN